MGWNQVSSKEFPASWFVNKGQDMTWFSSSSGSNINCSVICRSIRCGLNVSRSMVQRLLHLGSICFKHRYAAPCGSNQAAIGAYVYDARDAHHSRSSIFLDAVLTMTWRTVADVRDEKPTNERAVISCSS